MKTKSVFIIFLTVFTVFASCNISGIKGNGNVVKQKRKISNKFTEINVRHGINLYLSQGSNISVISEADENIQEFLITEVKNGVLNIYFSETTGNVKAKNVYVTMPEINKITASSAADVKLKTPVKSERLEIAASSGADIDAKTDVAELVCVSGSGADVEIKGICKTANLKSSSGADIDAEDLNAEIVTAKTSSGGDITISVSKEIFAEASSGGDITFYGNPKKTEVKTSSGGDIKQRNK